MPSDSKNKKVNQTVAFYPAFKKEFSYKTKNIQKSEVQGINLNKLNHKNSTLEQTSMISKNDLELSIIDENQ